MKYDYVECLSLIYGAVGTKVFTLSQVRPALKGAKVKVNGSVMIALREAGYIKQIWDRDLRAKGNHYVHMYRVTSDGEIMATRKSWGGIVLTSEDLEYIKSHYGYEPIGQIAQKLGIAQEQLSQELREMRKRGDLEINLDDYYTTAEVCEILEVGQGTVSNYAKAGRLSMRKIGFPPAGCKALYLKSEVDCFSMKKVRYRGRIKEDGFTWKAGDREYIRSHYGYERVRDIAKNLGLSVNTMTPRIRMMRAGGEMDVDHELIHYLSMKEVLATLRLTKMQLIRMSRLLGIPHKIFYVGSSGGAAYYLMSDVDLLSQSLAGDHIVDVNKMVENSELDVLKSC